MRQRSELDRAFLTVALAFLLSALAACSDLTNPDRIPDAADRTTSAFCEDPVMVTGNLETCDPPCDETAILCENPPADGYEEIYTDSVALDYPALVSAPEYTENGMIVCIPAFTQALVTLPIRLYPPDGGFSVIKPVVFTGLWVLERWLPGSAGSRGDYIFPPGYFPAADGSGVTVSVGKGRAVCSAPGGQYTVAFYEYFNVNARWPRVRPASGGGGGGPSDPAPSGCEWHWSTLEINYHDGTGWHVLWEGWALWCGFAAT